MDEIINQIIINLGPNPIEWFVIPKDSVDRYYMIIDKQVGIRSSAKETFDFLPSLGFFLENKIKCKVIT